MPSSFVLLLVVVVVLGIVGVLLRILGGSSGSTESSEPYSYSKKCLFTRAERSFLGVLEQALEGRYRVLGKIRLADVLEPAPGITRSSRQSAFNKISSKHIDFVIFAPDDLSPVAAVELDDSSHQRHERKTRDAFLEGALRTAGLPLVRFPVQVSYSLHEVRSSLGRLLLPLPAPSLAAATPEAGAAPAAMTPSAQTTHCSKCGGKLVERVGRKGPNAGKRFLGCENYPKCRNVVALSEPPPTGS